ncbi:ATP-binding cassette glutathione S-conjugate transporter ycf1 [Coemansia erecta]|nr:ATP-binding cassette glutathione S-conjugate transporter ycf1 [Coemansia erecta]
MDVMLVSYILHHLDSPHAQKHYVFGAALLLLFIKIVKMQGDHVSGLICQEWARVTQAIELEFFRLPLQDNGVRNPITTNMGRGNLVMFIESLRGIQMTMSQLIALAAAVLPVYRQIGVLLVVPFCMSAGKMALDFAVSQVTGGRHVHFDTCSNSGRGSGDSIDELHQNIRAVKMFGWEQLYLGSRRPSRARLCRTHVYYYIARGVWSVLDAIDGILDHLSSALIIYLYAQTGRDSIITNADLFWISGMISSLRSSVFGALNLINGMQSTLEHYQIIERFLRGDFVNTLPRLKHKNSEKLSSVLLNACSFRWNSRAQEPVIKHASLCVAKGEIVAVSGTTGSGKSALLLSISGELEMTSGCGHVVGRVGYLEQTPWILNDTLRANILFGRDFDAVLYNRVMHACAFIEDLVMWPKGDMTVIGDRGINISGGQRARLALARTLYTQADVYVLDDPLSAVDAHVKRHIMEHVILDSGMLAGKTRIIASNTNHIVPFATQLVTVENGNVAVRRQVPTKNMLGQRASQTAEHLARRDAIYVPSTSEEIASDNNDLNDDEEITKPSSVWDNARYIINLCTLPLLIATMFIGLVPAVVSHILDGHLLTALKPSADPSSTALLHYIMLDTGSQALMAMLVKLSYCAVGVVQQTYVADKLSHEFMRGIVHAPLGFFDSTDRHRMNAAYHEGVVSLASDIGRLVQSEISVIARTCFVVHRIARNVPALLLIAPVAAFLAVRIKHRVQPTLDALQEHIGTTSHAYCGLSDVVESGAHLIRQSQVSAHFTARVVDSREQHTRVAAAYDGLYAMLACVDRALSDASDFCVLIAVLVQQQCMNKGVGSAGFIQYKALTQLLATNCTLLMQVPTNVCASMGRCGVLRRFAGIKPEAPYIVDDRQMNACWPTQGRIEFRRFSMRYQAGLDYALRDIDLVISAGEKIGIVGRTGAGKSSLVKSLFRLVPADGTSGAISIDGQDIAEIGLGDLRPRLGIIPQESLMFPGTVRQNIDPLAEYDVERMWASLVKCRADRIVAANAKNAFAGGESDEAAFTRREIERKWQNAGIITRLYMMATGSAPFIRYPNNTHKARMPLDQTIEGAGRLSSGQRQLFSLCRLLMRKHRIVVLDEATADVDLNTDKHVQSVIRSEFADCTVLTIAHRLETVMNSDRIIVMEKGRVVEVGPPQELLKQKGHFARLVETNNF